MSSSRFTPATEAALRAAGWYSGRTVSEQQMDSWLILNCFLEIAPPRGYLKISPRAWHVLHEFGDLTIECATNAGGVVKLVLNPMRVVDCFWHIEYWDNIEWGIGEQLFPLGTMPVKADGHFDEFSPLAISNKGWVYSFADEFRLVGKSFDEALENLVAGKPGETIEMPDWKQYADITKAIQKRVDERERALLRGDWPQQEPVLWKDHLAVTDSIDFANLDWNAEAARVASAFGISQQCIFVGPALWRALLLANNPDRREWEYQRPPLSERLILRVNYRPGGIIFKIANSSLQTVAAAEISFAGYRRGDGRSGGKAALILAKALFHLGYLTPKIEAELGVNISQHEKLEWQMVFENTVSD